MWKLELDEDYFRIYDSKNMIAGYFDPDYGRIHPKENAEQIISSMLDNHDKIPGGLVMVPMVKFRLFDTDLDTTVSNVQENVCRVHEHLKGWEEFLASTGREAHSVRISHTDQDMLTITFHVKFTGPTPLAKGELIRELDPTLNLLQRSGLL